MADDIRIKDLQSTASYMESDDYLPIDSLALGNRKIPFTGLMDSEDDRLPTTDKTPRGAITEHEEDISEIKQSLSHYKDYTVTLSANSYVSPFTHLGTKNINGNLDGHTNYKITSILLLGGSSTQMGTVVYKGEGTSGDYINVYGNAAISMTIRVNYILTN